MYCWLMRDTTLPATFPNFTLFGHWDLEALAINQLVADDPANSFGWRTHIEIFSYANLPILGGPGVQILMFIQHDVSGHKATVINEFPESGPSWRWDKDGLDLGGGYTQIEVTPGFPYVFWKAADFAISDCFEFIRDAPAPVDFAEFNALDAYIHNLTPTVDTTGAWRMQFDVRLHDHVECMLLCKSFNTTRWTKIRSIDISYVNRVIVFTTPLNLEQWYHIDWRFNWDAPDGLYRVSVDGGPDDTQAGSAINVRWDRYSKRGAQLPIGWYDLKNLLFENGTALSSVVYLDQKLQVNACDDGPDARHGETFNMTLPSCP